MTVFSLVTLMPWGWFSLLEWFTTSGVVFLTNKKKTRVDSVDFKAEVSRDFFL